MGHSPEAARGGRSAAALAPEFLDQVQALRGLRHIGYPWGRSARASGAPSAQSRAGGRLSLIHI
eukprot:1010000-Alexandrium_andersonii.AAC.1